MNKSSNKLNINILTTLHVIIFIVFIGVCVFCISYYILLSKEINLYKNKLKYEINNINYINENTTCFTKGQSINTQKIIDDIPNSISLLQKSLSRLKNTTVIKKYKKDHENLLKGLKNNILMYKEILKICKNPESKKLDTHLKQLQKYKDECINYYTLISIKKMRINLPKESIELVNNSISYTERQVMLNLTNEVALNQNEDFLNSIDKILNKFVEIKKDYTYELSKARNSVNGYNNLLRCISYDQNILIDIKSQVSNLAIPNNAVHIYEPFIKILDDYEYYIENFKYTLKTEQLTYPSKINNDDSSNKLYLSCMEQIKTIEYNYTKFIKLYNEFQNKLSS